jgi:hypothetical protein
LAVAGLAAVMVLALALFAGRRMIAREVLVGWLRSHGIAATAQVSALGPGGVSGTVRAGDPDAPDFVAGDGVVTYGLRGLGLEVRGVRLIHPVVRARLHAGKLSFGALDPLVDELRRRPPRLDTTQPRIEIEQGLLLLTTDLGPLRVTADMTMKDGRLLALKASSASTHLRGARLEADLGPGSLRLRTTGDRVDISLDGAATRITAAGLAADGARLRLTAQAPYPDFKRHRDDGQLTVTADLSGDRFAVSGRSIAGARFTAALQGRTAGWIDTLTVTGPAQASLRAASGVVGAIRTGALEAHADVARLSWRRTGGDAGQGAPALTYAVHDLSAGDLRLPVISGDARGPVAFGPNGLVLALTADATGRGGWTGLGPPVAADSNEIAALKRGLRDLRISAPGVALRLAGGRTDLALTRPVRLAPTAGGEVVLTPRARGAWNLMVAGGGLPRVVADADHVSFSSGVMAASGRVKAGLSIGPVIDGDFDAAGALQIASGVTSFTASRCAVVKASRLELGVNDVLGLDGRLCPSGPPLLTLSHGAWRIVGRVDAAAANVPFLQARLQAAAGRIELGQARGRLSANTAIASAEIHDTAAATRFRPLLMSGTATLAGDAWVGALDFRTPAGQAIAHAGLRHATGPGVGRVEIATPTLRFAEGGLQPLELSPLATAVGSPAAGVAIFTGRFDWAPAGVASAGVLDIPRLDFNSPAGRVTGLSGRVAFTSLAPLIAAPGQVLRAEGVASAAPLSGVSVTFEVQEKALVISGGEAAVGGGRVRVDSLVAPLEPGKPMHGVLLVDGVQLHDLVEASPFGDRVDLDAKLSGRIPFETQDGKVRILGGDLHAIQPGRLSISRAALTEVSATGHVQGGQVATPVAPTAEPPTDTFTDFAYQAMENLAFDTLAATVATRADGRLGVLFHIVGRHDPPRRQEITLSLRDLIGRRFLTRKLPLPSDTGVDLTLDTTLNLDDLLRDYGDYQQLRSSRPVQPPLSKR